MKLHIFTKFKLWLAMVIKYNPYVLLAENFNKNRGFVTIGSSSEKSVKKSSIEQGESGSWELNTLLQVYNFFCRKN